MLGDKKHYEDPETGQNLFGVEASARLLGFRRRSRESMFNAADLSNGSPAIQELR
jgi:hypothetical protein